MHIQRTATGKRSNEELFLKEMAEGTGTLWKAEDSLGN